MSKNTYPLKLPTSVKKAAAALAATDVLYRVKGQAPNVRRIQRSLVRIQRG
jgi:hypothetical protein